MLFLLSCFLVKNLTVSDFCSKLNVSIVLLLFAGLLCNYDAPASEIIISSARLKSLIVLAVTFESIHGYVLSSSITSVYAAMLNSVILFNFFRKEITIF